MVMLTGVVILINIAVQVNTEKLFSLFHQEIAKRFDRVKDIPTQPILWYDLKTKVEKEFTKGYQEDYDAKMGYFIHVVPIPINRRAFQYNRYESDNVIGVPSTKWQLPAAEPLLPGHSLSRPTLGTLKSSVTFPHSENGAGVYGNSDNLGIRYGIRNGRVLYSNNRRMLHDNSWVNQNSTDSMTRSSEFKFYLVPISLNSVNMNKIGKRKRNEESDHTHIEKNKLSSWPPKKDYQKHLKILKTYIRNNSEGASKKKHIGRAQKMSPDENKSKQFWNTKNMFDHVKLNANKPELKDLIPPETNKVKRNWWYFNEDDLSQLAATLRKTA